MIRLEDDVTTMTHTELRDGARIVHFDGTLLGSASSEYSRGGYHKPRWTVFEIYRTTNGGYVVAKIGKSRIVHSTQTCKVLRNNVDPLQKVDLDEPGKDWEYCDPQLNDRDQCWTDATLDRATYGYLENDHAVAIPTEDAQAAISACYSRDHLGVFSISWLAKEALEEAFLNDSGVEDAYDHFDLNLLSRKNR
jgi:hypothetical protein